MLKQSLLFVNNNFLLSKDGHTLRICYFRNHVHRTKKYFSNFPVNEWTDSEKWFAKIKAFKGRYRELKEVKQFLSLVSLFFLIFSFSFFFLKSSKVFWNEHLVYKMKLEYFYLIIYKRFLKLSLVPRIVLIKQEILRYETKFINNKEINIISRA